MSFFTVFICTQYNCSVFEVTTPDCLGTKCNTEKDRVRLNFRTAGKH